MAQVELMGIVRDSSGVARATAESDAVVSDEVTVRELELAKGPADMGLDPGLPPTSWARWAEPVVITASVGVVLYLFFTK